jgi:hypothetical protein
MHKLLAQPYDHRVHHKVIMKLRILGTEWAIFKILPFSHFLSYKNFIIWKIHENSTRSPMTPSDSVLLYPVSQSGGGKGCHVGEHVGKDALVNVILVNVRMNRYKG